MRMKKLFHIFRGQLFVGSVRAETAGKAVEAYAEWACIPELVLRAEAANPATPPVLADAKFPPGTRCFACGRPMKRGWTVFTADDGCQRQPVGADCHAHIVAAGTEGFAPPAGGPRLFATFEAAAEAAAQGQHSHLG